MGKSAGQAGPRRVALLIESSRGYGRELIRGIARFNEQCRRWRIECTPRGLGDPPPAWLTAWKGDGILARIDDQTLARALAGKRVPVVDLRRKLRLRGVPAVGPDDAAVARLVFAHFSQRGFHRLAFVGLPPGTHKAMDARREHFRQLVQRAGKQYDQLNIRVLTRGDRWESQCRQIGRWLERLERPCAIMACNDDLGLQVLDACRRVSIRVPDEVVVVGVGNDECFCALSLPALTSVDLNPRKIGYEAAMLLDQMMDGQKVPDRETVVEPAGVVARMSSDVVATDDPHVARAVRYIRQHACDGIQVADVLQQVNLSRAALEPRFKQVLGCTVHQEIQRIRLSRAQQLLATTDMPIKQIARQVGFGYPEYLMRVFRRATGQTLKQYRQANRLLRDQWAGALSKAGGRQEDEKAGR